MKRSKKMIFHEFMTRKGLKTTRQRDIILDGFLASNDHMSIEDLYLKLRSKYPNIGYATVYRTLKLFSESGIAREIQFGDGQTRYEHTAEGEHHDHLVCTRCGEVLEFSNDSIEKLQDEIAERHGYQVHTHKLELYGICPNCRK